MFRYQRRQMKRKNPRQIKFRDFHKEAKWIAVVSAYHHHHCRWMLYKFRARRLFDAINSVSAIFLVWLTLCDWRSGGSSNTKTRPGIEWGQRSGRFMAIVRNGIDMKENRMKRHCTDGNRSKSIRHQNVQLEIRRFPFVGRHFSLFFFFFCFSYSPIVYCWLLSCDSSIQSRTSNNTQIDLYIGHCGKGGAGLGDEIRKRK